jgi:hypothetical protein
LRIDLVDNQLRHRPRRIKLTRIARRLQMRAKSARRCHQRYGDRHWH